MTASQDKAGQSRQERWTELAIEGEASAVVLEEAANVLAGSGFAGLAGICREQAERQRVVLAKARGEAS